jgi:hypothetical protein
MRVIARDSAAVLQQKTLCDRVVVHFQSAIEKDS